MWLISNVGQKSIDIANVPNQSPLTFGKKMNPLLRKLNLVLAIGGGFTGIVVTLQAFFTSKEANPMVYAMFTGFIGL